MKCPLHPATVSKFSVAVVNYLAAGRVQNEHFTALQHMHSFIVTILTLGLYGVQDISI